ncbi:MAG TPA: YjbE family putative metal transport protein, partial [Ktedonobacteraceae bacterium]|nr:YjbE family putative metal transport protein [Ktedonobacteraceae bacterium]
LLDLILSGDNALVIGVAAAGLPRHQRWYALLIGGAGAIVLRILLTALASVILNIPFLQSIGALFLVYISVNLLLDRTEPASNLSKPSDVAFLSALRTIIIADVTMSLDNILAVGALSNGDLLPLVFGLLFSISILLVGSAFISVIAERFEWLLYLAVLVLGWTSAAMIHDDLFALGRYPSFAWLRTLGSIKLLLNQTLLQLILAVLMWLAIAGFYLYFKQRAANARSRKQAASSSSKNMAQDASRP